ncbi:MAG: hypothetical protein WA160_16085 [Pseudobdellovibrio sp.]
MRVKNKALLKILILIVLTGCSSLSFKEKILTNTLVASAAGYVIGQSEKEHKKEYSIMYAGIASGIAAIATTYISDPDRENVRLRNEMAKMQSDFDAALKPKLESSSSGLMNSKIPEKYKSMINPGEWKVYSLDQWTEDNENRLIHQDKMMELIPPSLKPMSLPTTTERK